MKKQDSNTSRRINGSTVRPIEVQVAELGIVPWSDITFQLCNNVSNQVRGRVSELVRENLKNIRA